MEEIVPRPSIIVRRVTPDFESDFAALCTTAHLEAGRGSAIRVISEGPDACERRVAVALAGDDVRAYMAVLDEQPVGYIVLSRRPLSFLTDAQCVSIEQIFVVRDARRSGAARALVSAATTYADRLGADQIASSVPSHGREANRFFARLGFSSYVVRRVTTTSALRRKLASRDEPHPALDQLLQRRRSLRVQPPRVQAPRSATLEQLLQRRRSLRAKATGSLSPSPDANPRTLTPTT
jgi:GNAT superfamily N-acetyltransferase